MAKYDIPPRPTGCGLVHRGVTPPTEEELRRLVHEEFRTYREIGDLYGVDLTAVPQWLKKFGIPPANYRASYFRGEMPTLTPEKAKARYEAGESAASIAADTGYKSGTTVLNMLGAIGVERRADGWRSQRLKTASGCEVRSTYEVRVADWLTAHGLEFVYEPDLPFGHGNSKADFLVNGWYIEVWGVHSRPSYAARKAWKQGMYATHNLPLIELSPHHFSRDKHIMERRLEQTLEVAERPTD